MAFIGFPNPVNEVAARTVAAGVVLLSTATFVLSLTVSTRWLWLTAVLVYGFAARVLAGPRISPLGLLATRVIAVRIGHEKLVPGPPKRFAQALGLGMSTLALLFHALGWHTAALVFVGLIVLAASLESVFALCLGCKAFAVLMRLGVIPPETCEACNNFGLRYSPTATG